MRTLVEPAPASHCDRCGGELRLKLIVSASGSFDSDNEVFVCAECRREQSFTVSHDHYRPRAGSAWSTILNSKARS
jgi:hypothetical protein